MDQPENVTDYFNEQFAAFLAGRGFEECGPDAPGAVKWREKIVEDGAEYNATRYGRPA